MISIAARAGAISTAMTYSTCKRSPRWISISRANKAAARSACFRSRSAAPLSAKLLRRVPAADVRHQAIGLWWAPAARLILEHRTRAVNHRVDDGPRGLDHVLAREQRRVAG